MQAKIKMVLKEFIKIIWNGFLIAVGIAIAEKFMGA